MIQSNGKNRAEDNVIRQMQVFHEKECEFCGKSAFCVLYVQNGFKFVKIGVFTFEKNILYNKNIGLTGGAFIPSRR